MKALNQNQINDVKAKFPNVASFGILGINIIDNKCRLIMDYDIFGDCGYDEELNALHQYVEQNYTN